MKMISHMCVYVFTSMGSLLNWLKNKRFCPSNNSMVASNSAKCTIKSNPLNARVTNEWSTNKHCCLRNIELNNLAFFFCFCLFVRCSVDVTHTIMTAKVKCMASARARAHAHGTIAYVSSGRFVWNGISFEKSSLFFAYCCFYNCVYFKLFKLWNISFPIKKRTLLLWFLLAYFGCVACVYACYFGKG